MIKIPLIVSAIALCAGLTAAQAGSKCCPLTKAKAAAESAEAQAGCDVQCFEAIEMTDEQKAQVAELAAACKGEKCSETSAKKMKAGLKEVLSEDQLASLKKNCNAKGCGLAKADAEATETDS